MIRAVWVAAAIILVLGALALEWAGGRAAASVVAGAVGSLGQALLGAAYVVVHLAAVIAAPVLLGAAALASIGRKPSA